MRHTPYTLIANLWGNLADACPVVENFHMLPIF